MVEMNLLGAIPQFWSGLWPAAWRKSRSNLNVTAPRFTYKALEQDCIRILTLLPAEKPYDPIRCTIRSISRADAASCYSALSYVWGPEQPCASMETITVLDVGLDGQAADCVLAIRHNLHGALMALRQALPAEGIPPRLWIDAVCINQNDASEKTEQIQCMDQTYMSATNVVIWLGPSADDSDYVMDAIHKRAFVEYRSRRFITGLLAVLTRTWYSRTWIVQELVLNGASPLVACGTAGGLVTWSQIEEAYAKAIPTEGLLADADDEEVSLQHWEVLLSLLPQIQQSILGYKMLASMRKGLQSTRSLTSGLLGSYSLHYAIRATRSFHATDARDRIYGILALTDEDTRKALEVHYAKPVEHVFRDAAWYILKRERAAAIYALSPLRMRPPQRPRRWGPSSSPSSLPSWVPDFSAPYNIHDDAPPQLLDPSRPLLHHAEDVDLSPCGTKLVTKALFLDTIEVTHATPAGPSTTPLSAYPQLLAVFCVAYVGNVFRRGSFSMSLSEVFTRCVETKRIVDLCRSLSEIECLSDSRASRASPSTAKEPLWAMLFLAMSQSEQETLYSNHTRDELQEQFDTFMRCVRTIAKREGRRPWYTRYMLNDHISLMFDDTVSKTEAVSRRILDTLQVQRTFVAGRGLWYGFSEGGGVREGDRLALLFPGADIPFVLRENKNGAGENCYAMIGVARVSESAREAAASQGGETWSQILIN